MSDLWLGAFLALAVWFLFQVAIAAVFRGETMEIGIKHIIEYTVFTLACLVLAVLTYTGVIL